MTLPAVQEDWTLSGKGLKIRNPDLTYEEFEHICAMLGDAHAGIKFAIGDAILRGEELFGERVYQAAEKMNLSAETMRECVRVSARVPMSSRRVGVSWSHHRAVASLPPPEQKEWLRRCATEDISHHALRESLRSNGSEAIIETCPSCGKRL